MPKPVQCELRHARIHTNIKHTVRNLNAFYFCMANALCTCILSRHDLTIQLMLFTKQKKKQPIMLSTLLFPKT